MIGVVNVLFTASFAFGFSLDAYFKNREGIDSIEKENYYMAYRNFVDALGYEPFRPELKMNLGISYYLNEEFEKAYKEFMAAHRMSKTPEVKFFALFNAADAKAKQKQIDQALNLYQQALEIHPQSIEVKTNIELLMQQGGGGGGEGDPQDKKQDGDGQGQSQNQEPQQEGEEPKKKKPKPFDSKKLTKDDVRKILEELKEQEQEIRAKEYSKGRKDKANDKDW